MYKNKKILILDDEKIVTSTLKTLLVLEGFTDVNLFNSPEEALEFLKLQRPDLIISDFIMPEMNGLEFLKRAKSMYPDVCMMLLTGYADKENALRAINEVGLYKYIEKPWDNDDLIINIKNGIEKSKLVTDLKDKIAELNHANEELEKYSQKLEEMVEARTRKIEETSEQLNAVIKNCADGIMLLSKDFQILSVNDATENLFGLGRELIKQKSPDELICDAEGKPFTNAVKTKETSEKIIGGLYAKNIVNGTQIPIEISLAFIEKNDCFICVLRDITKAKEIEKLREDFIATLTHDLRTPLLAAIQTLKFFNDGSLGELTEKQGMLLKAMAQSNKDMLGLVNALLEVYKYESGKSVCVKNTFAVNDLINGCCDEISSLACAKQIEITKDLDKSFEPEIYADRSELKRVIINLLGNAVNHTPDGGQIVVKTKLTDSDFMFSVKDTGIGISGTDTSKIFTRFSGVTQKTNSVGTGLGLYLSKRIVESYSGKIWFESAKNKGSEFFFLLPDVIKSKVGVEA